MTIKKIIERWDHQGKLEGIRREFSEVASALHVPSEISETRKLTAEQIRICFDNIFHLQVLILKKCCRKISIRNAMHRLRARMRKNDFIQDVFQFAIHEDVSEIEGLQNARRKLENLKWQMEEDK